MLDLAESSKMDTQMSKIIGQVIGIDEKRDLIEVLDHLGNVCDMVPVEGSIRMRLKVSLPTPSNGTVEFWVDAPPEVSAKISERVSNVPYDKLGLQDVTERAFAYQKDYEASLAASDRT